MPPSLAGGDLFNAVLMQPPTPGSNHLFARWDDGVTHWDRGARWDSAPAPVLQQLISHQPLAINNAMEFWEITQQRAQETLPVWTQYVPTLLIKGQGRADLNTLIDGFEPLVQERTAAQDRYDQSYRNCQDALLRMKILGTKVPAIIEGQLNDDTRQMKELEDVYRTAPRAESTILKRLRELLPVWERANAALAADQPPQPAIVRKVGGVIYTTALARTLLDSYTALVKVMKDEEEALDVARAKLRKHDSITDGLNKSWYKVVKASSDPEDDVYLALNGITTEPSTPAPDAIEINTVAQGGDDGLQVLVEYLPGGGEHATTKLIKWQVVGVDADFTHSAPLDREGNALGPFKVGQVVRVITEVGNSSGTRSTAARTIRLEEPVG